MATGPITGEILSNGFLRLSCSLSGTPWVAVTYDSSEVITVRIDNGGGFQRNVYADLNSAYGSLTVTGASFDVVQLDVPLVGEYNGNGSNPEYNDAHTGEAVRFQTSIPAGFFTDSINTSEEVLGLTAITNNSSIAKPTPIANWAMIPKQVYTGDIVARVNGFSKYGLEKFAITLSDDVDSITKEVTARTSVTVGDGTIYPSTVVDLYEVTFTAAEISSNNIDDGTCTLSFTATCNSGTTRSSSPTGTPKNLPIYNDQAGTFEAGLSTVYVDNRHSVTTGALTGGSSIAAGSIVSDGTNYGYVTEAYSGSGTLKFVPCNKGDIVFANTDVLTAYDFGTLATQGITCTCTADSAPMIAENAEIAGNDATLGWGLSASDTIVLSPYKAMRYLDAQNTSSTADGYIKLLTPSWLWGEPSSMFWQFQAENESWTYISKADGFTDDQVFLMPGFAASSGRLKAYEWVYLDGLQLRNWDESSDFELLPNASGEQLKFVLDGLTNTDPTTPYQITQSNVEGIWWINCDFNGALVNWASAQAVADSNINAYGCYLMNVSNPLGSDWPDAGDMFIFSTNEGHVACMNVDFANLGGSGAGNHSDGVQTTGGGTTGINCIFHNYADVDNDYQNVFLGSGCNGMAFVNFLMEQVDDGDVGSAGVAVGTAADVNHLIMSHGTVLAQASTNSQIWQGSSNGDNVLVHCCTFTGIQPPTSDLSDLITPVKDAFINCHSENGSAVGIRGTAGGTEASLYEDGPGNSGAAPSGTGSNLDRYAAADGGTLDGRLEARDNIHGLITDMFGRAYAFDGTGSIGSGMPTSVSSSVVDINESSVRMFHMTSRRRRRIKR